MQRAISGLRWEKAQVYERDFWSRQVLATTGEVSRYRWYEDRAQKIWTRVKPFLASQARISVLEIGPGPVGIVNYLEADERHALDPLEDYYSSQPEFERVRDRGVVRHRGTGEDVLSLGKTFSFIILDNVLDHMKDPGRVLRGIHGSLDLGGGHVHEPQHLHAVRLPGAEYHGMPGDRQGPPFQLLPVSRRLPS